MALVASLLVGVPACTRSDVGSQRAAIAGGTLDTAPARFLAVVHIAFPLENPTSDRTFGTCTGTLVSPSHVVTAAHCAALTSRAWEGARGFDFPGEPRRQGRITIRVTTRPSWDSTPRIERTVRACAVHPDYAGAGSTNCRDAFEFARTNATRCQLQLQHDVAVLTLDQPVPVSWATGLPGEPFDLLGEVRTDFHRLLSGAEIPMIEDAVAEVGFGYSDARLRLGIGDRRFRDATIVGFDLMGADVVRLSGNPTEGILGGDSGGPVIWTAAPAVPPGTYAWRAPPIGVHSCSEGDDPSRIHHTSLIMESNLEFVRDQLDRNGDDRFDAVCEPQRNPGDGVCQYRETCGAEPEDCGACPPSCNNAACEPELGETCANCRADCGFCEPTFPVGLGFAISATPDNDRDGDGIFDVDDNAPDHFNPCQEDRDGDGVGDTGDNCPDDVNPVQESSDADSRGDACDNCPLVANEDQRDVDVEIPDPAGGSFPTRRGDGVGDACDNCPEVLNVDQTLDCNADAVAALNDARSAVGLPLLDVRGDACDPIPCGETEIVDWIERTPAGTRIHSDRVEVDARAFDDPALGARTTFRFCPCRIQILEDRDGDGIEEVVGLREPTDRQEDRVLCAASDIGGGCALNQIDLITSPDDPLPDEIEPWRYTTHRRLDAVAIDGIRLCRPEEPPGTNGCVPALPIERAAQYPTSYDRFDQYDDWEADRYNQWRLHDVDVPRWVALFGPPPSGEPHPSPSGVLWTHTPGVNDGSDPADYPFFAARDEQTQASHYWSGRVLSPFDVPDAPIDPHDVWPIPIAPFLGFQPICPFCRSSFPAPFWGFPSRLGQADLGDPSLYLGTTKISGPGALEVPGVEIFANDAGPWSAAAESDPYLPVEGLRYVQLAEGSSLTRAIVEVDGSLRDVLDFGGCDLLCEEVPTSFVAPLAAGARMAHDAAPAPRREHAEVLSARRGAVWVLGGESLDGGEPLHDVWVYDLDERHWCPLGAPELGRVLAATYSAAEDVLWVLDEAPSERPRGADRRLWRLDPLSGTGEAIASWPARSSHDRFALSADRAGSLYVVGWRERGGAHSVLRLAWLAGAGVDVLGWTTGAGRPIGGAVRASSRGLTLYVEQGRSRVLAVGYRSAELSTAPGGASRCF